MSYTDHFEKLTRMYLNAATNNYYAPSISIQKGSATVEIVVRPEFLQSAGFVHGSVFFKLLDDSAYFAAQSAVTDAHLLTSSFNCYFLRPVSTGILEGIGTLTHRSKRIIIAESRIIDDKERIIAQGSGTFLKADLPLDEKVGYF
ncbi:MAG: PaaI family thioesterase [Chitinispirillaceae bacterium]|nr:PaaI family thioesterase [Chitinispirillaceae bacterium]